MVKLQPASAPVASSNRTVMDSKKVNDIVMPVVKPKARQPSPPSVEDIEESLESDKPKKTKSPSPKK